MSILIKGLNMPKDGNEVFIIIKPNGEVRDYHNILLTNAQAVEIPTPHGRIVDYDRIFKDCTDLTSAECNPRWYPPIVILEAEE